MWNISIAVGGMLLFTFINKLGFGFDIVIPYGPATFALRIAYGLILVYGIGYYFVSTDLSKNRGIVWMGILGKIAVFLTAIMSFAVNQFTIICFLLAIGDLIFVCLFGYFLIKTNDEF